MLPDVACGTLHLLEAEAHVRIKIEHQPIGRFDILHTRAPAMEFDRAHLHAGEDAVEIIDIEVIFVLAAALLDRDVAHMSSERPSIMFLEEAFLGASLRATDQA